VAFLAFFFGVPVYELLRGGFYGADGALGLEQYRRIAETSVYSKVLFTTFAVAGATAGLSVFIGYPVAYQLSRMAARMRARWLVWLLVPFWTSYLVKTFAWILVLSRTGVVSAIARALGAGDLPALLPSLGGVLVGMVHGLLPLAVMTMLPTMQGINAQLTQAAETLGASRTVSFWTVFLPLSAPGAAAAGLLVFITSLGFFIVPTLLGTPRETMISQVVIISVLEVLNLHFAGALSTVLLVCALFVFVAYDRLVGLSSLAGEPRASPRGSAGLQGTIGALVAMGRWADGVVRLVPARLGKGRTVKAYTVAVVALLALPIAVVLPIAFTRSTFLSFPPQGFSLQWFEECVRSPIWQAAWMRSLGVAAATASASIVLGLGASLALTRLPARWGKALFAFLIAPLIVPRIVIALGLFYLYGRLHLSGTDLGLVIGHTVLAIPYVVIPLAAALKRFDWRLEDAARILGASAFDRLRTVLVPMLWPTLVSAFLFAFITSFDELTIAIFVSGGLKTTLPKQMWDQMQLELSPTLAAVSAVLTVLVVLTILVPTFLRRTEQAD
jgi:putative spermidine/putrescine transport system permease protein